MSTDKGLDNRNCQSNLRILLFTCIWVSNWCHGKSAAIIIYFDCGFLDKIYIDNFIPWKFGIAHVSCYQVRFYVDTKSLPSAIKLFLRSNFLQTICCRKSS